MTVRSSAGIAACVAPTRGSASVSRDTADSRGTYRTTIRAFETWRLDDNPQNRWWMCCTEWPEGKDALLRAFERADDVISYSYTLVDHDADTDTNFTVALADTTQFRLVCYHLGPFYRLLPQMPADAKFIAVCIAETPTASSWICGRDLRGWHGVTSQQISYWRQRRRSKIQASSASSDQ